MSVFRISISTIVAILAGIVVMLMVSSHIVLSLLTQATIYAVFAVGLGILLRQNGHASFGHALFFGLAGYAMAIILRLDLMPAEAAVVVTLLGMGVFAFLIGLVMVRVPGIAFSMLTLAVGQMGYLTISRSRGWTGGADGMGIDWPARLFGFTQAQLLQPSTWFLICWVVLVVVIALLTLLLRGRFGAVTEAVRDNEERARFIGISTVLPRAVIFALSAMVTGLSGVLAGFNTGFISPESLHWSLSGMMLMMVIVGGFKVLWGPALGAAAYFLLKDVLGEFASHWMAIFGVVLITVIVFSPTGIAGALQRLLGANNNAKPQHAIGINEHSTEA
ncbi:branched-chain amino acid ABC transporter permease [Alcaligenaceae bacterium CGII-47]|nr:branched-chain amino acid ABC transporter permease [Alcaligenaceae bacterium CGII-47]